MYNFLPYISGRHYLAVRGFSLIEMLVTVAIISLLATIIVPVSQLVHKRNNEVELKVALRQIRTALDEYKDAVERGWIYASKDASGYPASLSDLVDGVDDRRNLTGGKLYFLRRIPRDPMASDVVKKPEDTWQLRSYDSPPSAPRSGKDVYDVMSKSTEIGINGKPYNEW